jgi:hypothetical protein
MTGRRFRLTPFVVPEQELHEAVAPPAVGG